MEPEYGVQHLQQEGAECVSFPIVRNGVSFCTGSFAVRPLLFRSLRDIPPPLSVLAYLCSTECALHSHPLPEKRTRREFSYDVLLGLDREE